MAVGGRDTSAFLPRFPNAFSSEVQIKRTPPGTHHPFFHVNYVGALSMNNMVVVVSKHLLTLLNHSFECFICRAKTVGASENLVPVFN